MRKPRFVVSLITRDNDFQMEQAASAEEVARKLGVDLQILFADGDSIQQSQQILKLIQSSSDSHPDGILVEPVGGTGLPQVARAAASAGIGWVVLNRDVEYLADLRRSYKTVMFSVSSDHEEIGRIQAQQFGALLPHGGEVLYIQGASESSATKGRTTGMYEAKPADIQVKLMKGSWTEASAYKTVSSWLRLSTSQQTHIGVIAGQNDAMAVGARKAFQEIHDTAVRDRWLSLPYIGCDGVPKTGQAWVRSGLLAATVIAPPMAGQALEMLVHSLQTGLVPPEKTLTAPRSFPSIETLGATQAEKARTLSSKH